MNMSIQEPLLPELTQFRMGLVLPVFVFYLGWTFRTWTPGRVAVIGALNAVVPLFWDPWSDATVVRS